ncbi:SirB1 family protein [Paraglaciecola marina]|uniref:SirB1 family protein n=1 Tax=Paraglaciecola marina TaxID=2500157 RepID=UPI00105EB5F4|nr:tetratricopeptide repeat protein [Paraglaciecola marina]
MKELQQAIIDQDCLLAGLQVATTFQNGVGCLKHYQQQLSQWKSDAELYIGSPDINAVSFSRFIAFFFVELAFSGSEENYFSSQYSLINKVLEYRTGMPVSLAIVFQSLGKSLGFDIHGVNFPGYFLVKCNFDDGTTVFVDPLNGKQLSRDNLQALYFSILNEFEDEEMPEEALNEACCEETLVRLLHNLKSAYISEKKYAEALGVVETLVQLCPNDPYERRDRGFLLHQLDCTQVAIADYQFFIRQCPKDPATQLLQAQLQQLSEQVPVVLH